MARKVMVADPDPRGRLRAVSALHGRYDVVTPDPTEELVRAVRRLRPEVVLLAMPRGRSGQAFRSCRTLKTDGRDPPAVGLTDRWCRLGDPKASLSSCLGDGYLGGQVTPQQWLRFVGDMLEGKSPVVVMGEPEASLWTSLIRRR